MRESSPGGAPKLSPALQRWEESGNDSTPKGTTELAADGAGDDHHFSGRRSKKGEPEGSPVHMKRVLTAKLRTRRRLLCRLLDRTGS